MFASMGEAVLASPATSSSFYSFEDNNISFHQWFPPPLAVAAGWRTRELVLGSCNKNSATNRLEPCFHRNAVLCGFGTNRNIWQVHPATSAGAVRVAPDSHIGPITGISDRRPIWALISAIKAASIPVDTVLASA